MDSSPSFIAQLPSSASRSPAPALLSRSSARRRATGVVSSVRPYSLRSDSLNRAPAPAGSRGSHRWRVEGRQMAAASASPIPPTRGLLGEGSAGVFGPIGLALGLATRDEDIPWPFAGSRCFFSCIGGGIGRRATAKRGSLVGSWPISTLKVAADSSQSPPAPQNCFGLEKIAPVPANAETCWSVEYCREGAGEKDR